jgi:hypothetical protein
MPITRRNFYVPSLEPKPDLFLQKMITIIFIVVIFAFGLVLSPVEIKDLIFKFTAALILIFEGCLEVLSFIWEIT